jgi:hypothetical protein
MLPTLDAALPEPEAEAAEEPAPDSQFESFYDQESGVWTLRRIPSSPPPCDVQDDAA